MTQTIDIADLDVVFLTYDEPLKEEFWVKIKNMVPWAVRVDGVKGSDAAHKAAADAAQTDRFILIDGDNLPDPEFFNLVLEFPNNEYNNAVFRWRARNHINGLMYGNGGISCWTKEFVYNMKTHEASVGNDETDIEFCFDPLYWPMHDCYSTTHPNQSAMHAWRAGFREGVKMCLNKGALPTIGEFKDAVHKRNMDHLSIWHNVGLDVDNGAWAILGARQGTRLTMFKEWNYKQVHDFDHLNTLFIELTSAFEPNCVLDEIERLGEELASQLDLPMCVLTPNQSKFFKHHYRSNWRNRGPMVREIDVIREEEGW
jgi:hypothetical protein